MKFDEKDKILYKAFLKGDLSAFDEIMIKYRKSVFCFINGYVKNPDVAEDLAQDVFVYLLIKRTDYDFKYSMKTYLYTIARSRALNFLKKEKHFQFEDYYVENDCLIFDSNVEETILNYEKRRAVYNAMFKLNHNQRTVIYLSDFEGFSNLEISETIGKSIPEVKMIHYRARKNLKKILDMEDMI